MKDINNESNLETGRIIKKRRESLGFSQQDVADRVNVSKSAISRWESGEVQNMGRTKIHLLANVLKISPVAIVLGKEDTETDGSTLEEEEPSTEKLKQYFEKNYHKLAALPNDDKEKLIKMIDIYLD